jgi:hypothetical protein
MVDDSDGDYFCGLCNKSVVNDCIECSICNCWVHRYCAKLSKKSLKEKSSNDMYWYCKICEEIFPFHSISNNELSYTFSNLDTILNNYELYEKCSEFNFETFKYSEYKKGDFEKDLDPDNNFYNDIQTKCNYYTDEQFNKKFKKEKGLSVIHFNARSLRKNFDKIEKYIFELDHLFDVIAISETWLDTRFDPNEFQLKGYEMYREDRTCKRGGGVAIYIKDHLKCKVLSEFCKTVDEIFECFTVEICIEKAKNIIISCFYRAPDSSLEKFNECIETHLCKLPSSKTIYVCGDFNIDLLKGGSHNKTGHFIDTMFNAGMFPLINKPTHIGESAATLIDIIFTNDLALNYSSGLLINDITDHLPVFLFSEYVIKKKKKLCIIWLESLMTIQLNL